MHAGIPVGKEISLFASGTGHYILLVSTDGKDICILDPSYKEGKYEELLEEIKAVKKACDGRILKVIIETCLLTEEEKKEMCRVVTEAGADFIKTSTGFSKAGATFADIELFANNIGEGVQMKAAGGISSLEDAEKFLSLGATRLGTSRIVKLLKEGAGAGEGSY